MLYRAIVLGILFLFIVSSDAPILTTSHSATTITAGPYLQQVTTTEITIRWATSQPTTENLVQWGLAITTLNLS